MAADGKAYLTEEDARGYVDHRMLLHGDGGREHGQGEDDAEDLI